MHDPLCRSSRSDGVSHVQTALAFNPDHPGKFTGTGTLDFEQNITLPVNFVAKAKKH